MSECEQQNRKKQIVNINKELKLIENKLSQLRTFYKENKDKLDYELVATFFDNFIEIHITNEYSVFFSNDNYKNFLNFYKHSCDYPTVVDFDKKGKECFNQIYNEEQNKLFLKKLILKQKLEYYENLYNKKKITDIITCLSNSLIFFVIGVVFIIAVMISIFILNHIFYQLMSTSVTMHCNAM